MLVSDEALLPCMTMVTQKGSGGFFEYPSSSRYQHRPTPVVFPHGRGGRNALLETNIGLLPALAVYLKVLMLIHVVIKHALALDGWLV